MRNTIEAIIVHISRKNSKVFVDCNGLHHNYIVGRLLQVSPDWFVDLVSLTTLRLQFNRLPTIYASSFYPLLSLTSLDLSANQLTHIYGNAFTGLAQLKTLNLSNNPLENVNGAFGEFSMIDVIDLSATHFRLLGNGGGGSACFVDVNVTMVIANRMARLSLIDRGAFTNMPHTTVIHLANNTALKYVDDQAFINTPMLRELHLNSSALLSLELSAELLRRVEDKTLQVFLTGNPLRCDCRDYLARVTPSSLQNFAALCKSRSSQQTELGMLKQNASCQPRIVHVSEATYDKTVGDGLSLACRSVPKHAVQWSFQFSTSSSSSQPLPASSSSSTLSASLPGDAAVNDRGQLTINFLLTSHQGTYTCHVKDPTGSDAFSIAVRVRSADAAIIFLGSSATSVTVTWRAHVTPGGAPYVLTYRPTDVINATQRVIDIRMPMRSFTVSGLRTSVIYEFCICLRRTASPAAVLPVACDNIATRRKDGAYSGVASMQRAVLVGVIGSVLGVVTLVCALSHAVKRYNRRKLLQEQLRGDPSSELYLAGVDFLSAESAPVTYENPAAVDAYDVTNSDDDNDDGGGGGDTDDGEYFGGRTRTADDANHYDDASNFDDYGHPQTSSL